MRKIDARTALLSYVIQLCARCYICADIGNVYAKVIKLSLLIKGKTDCIIHILGITAVNGIGCELPQIEAVAAGALHKIFLFEFGDFMREFWNKSLFFELVF